MHICTPLNRKGVQWRVVKWRALGSVAGVTRVVQALAVRPLVPSGLSGLLLRGGGRLAYEAMHPHSPRRLP